MTHVTTRYGVDGNGVPTETMLIDGHQVCVHYDDIPESDVTVIGGIRVTTALRTIIDIAPDITLGDLDRVIEDALRRRLFTVADALERTDRADMLTRRGAHLLRSRLPR